MKTVILEALGSAPGAAMQKAIGTVLNLAKVGRISVETLEIPVQDVETAWDMLQDPDKRLVLTFGAGQAKEQPWPIS